jgi:hypothetical protein
MIAIRNSHPTIQIIGFHAVHDSRGKPANLFTDTVKNQNSDGFDRFLSLFPSIRMIMAEISPTFSLLYFMILY